jgi:hypothetical protein
MILFEEIAMRAPQVALVGDIYRSKTLIGDSEEEKAEPGKIVVRKKPLAGSLNISSLKCIHWSIALITQQSSDSGPVRAAGNLSKVLQ